MLWGRDRSSVSFSVGTEPFSRRTTQFRALTYNRYFESLYSSLYWKHNLETIKLILREPNCRKHYPRKKSGIVLSTLSLYRAMPCPKCCILLKRSRFTYLIFFKLTYNDPCGSSPPPSLFNPKNKQPTECVSGLRCTPSWLLYFNSLSPGPFNHSYKLLFNFKRNL